MQRVMQNNAAVFRTQETLEEGNLLFADITVLQPFSFVGLGVCFTLTDFFNRLSIN